MVTIWRHRLGQKPAMIQMSFTLENYSDRRKDRTVMSNLSCPISQSALGTFNELSLKPTGLCFCPCRKTARHLIHLAVCLNVGPVQILVFMAA